MIFYMFTFQVVHHAAVPSTSSKVQMGVGAGRSLGAVVSVAAHRYQTALAEVRTVMSGGLRANDGFELVSVTQVIRS